MITLYLIRHATYSNPRGILPGRLPVELSAEGIEEAKRLRKYFVDKTIERIYSSAVLRCKQTAEIISSGKIPLEYDQRLLETHSAYQGYWVDDVRFFYGVRNELGGESYQDVQNRLAEFYRMTHFENGKKYIICSHGDPLYFLYKYLTQQQLQPEHNTSEKVTSPRDYPQMGSILPLIIEAGKVKMAELITQEFLT